MMSLDEILQKDLNPDIYCLVHNKIVGLQQENKQLNGAIQTYDILLKSNVEENKRLKRTINESTKMIDECACYNEKDKECKCNFSSMAMTTLRKILKGEITSYHEDKKVSE